MNLKNMLNEETRYKDHLFEFIYMKCQKTAKQSQRADWQLIRAVGGMRNDYQQENREQKCFQLDSANGSRILSYSESKEDSSWIHIFSTQKQRY